MVPNALDAIAQKENVMTSVTSSAVSGSASQQASQQASRLALLVRLFQTDAKASHGGKTRPTYRAAAPPPQPPAQTNSAGGLASMFEALQTGTDAGVSDGPSRLLQAVDTHGDGTISAIEAQVMTELTAGPSQAADRPSLFTALTRHHDINDDGLISKQDVAAGPVVGPLVRDFATVDSDSNGHLSQTELDQFEQTLRNRDGADPAQGTRPALGSAPTKGQLSSAYEALFQALQLVFAQPKVGSGTTIGQRYTDLLQSLATSA